MNNQADTGRNSRYSGVGFLIVKISAARGAIPIDEATVYVYGTNKNDTGLYAVVTTDADGIAKKIPLPAPPKKTSATAGQDSPFAKYNLEIIKNGYYSEEFIEVPIFDTITSIQPVYLMPLSSDRQYNSYRDTRTTDTENPDL